MAGLFISYRHGDTPGDVDRIVERLEERIPARFIFLDRSHIRPGASFPEVIDGQVRAADVVLVMIGPTWLTASDTRGRRLDAGDKDVVHREVRLALASGALVVPLLLRGAVMPQAIDLPTKIRALASQQAHRIDQRHFDRDIEELIRIVMKRFPVPRSRIRRALLLYPPCPSARRPGWRCRICYYLLLPFVIALVIGLPATQPSYGRTDGWLLFLICSVLTLAGVSIAAWVHNRAYMLDTGTNEPRSSP